MKKIFTLLTLLLCAVTSSWGSIVSFEFPNSYLANTSGSLDGTGCSVTYSGIGNTSGNAHIEGSDPGTYYLKMTGNSAYVQISLTASGDKFQAGDVLTIDAWINNESTSKGFYLKSSSGNKAASTGISGVQSIVYTLVAADIEDDGSIKLFRVDSNSFLHGVSVNHTAVSGPSFTMTTPATTTDVAINTSVVLTADEAISAVGASITGTIKAGDADATAITFVLSGTTLTYTPASVLDYNTTYVVKVNANQVQNGKSQKNAEKSFTFKTMAIPSTTTTANAAASDQTKYFDNSGTISTDSKTLSLTGVPVTIAGTGTFQNGSDSYQFTISESNYTAIKVSKNATYVITPGAGVTVNSVNVYATSNTGNTSQISTYDETSQTLPARGTSGTPVSPTAFPLSKNASGNYEFTISGNQSIVVVVVNYDVLETVDVTVSAAGYATLYYDKKLAIPTDVTAYYATVKDGATISLHKINNVIPANTGVILKADAGKYNFAVTTDDATTDVSTNKLTGTTTGTTVEAGSVYTLGQNALGVVGLRLYSGTSIRAYSAYATSIAGARDFYEIGLDGDVTAIKNVKVGAEDNIYYDLQGRRVLYPKKGLYIVNGKKVIIK